MVVFKIELLVNSGRFSFFSSIRAMYAYNTINGILSYLAQMENFTRPIIIVDYDV
jgi:hypothetical protein